MIHAYYKRLYLLLLFVLLSACGGGGSGGEPANNTPPDTTAPTASLVPTHSSSNVDSTTNIIATFDEDMFANTINADNFTLRGTGDDIDATVSFDALTNIATLNPNTTLGLLKTYTARLKPGITDLSGNPLALTTATFTTRDGSWNGPAFLLDGASGGGSNFPEVAVNPNGDAIVVFQKLDGDVSNIYANHYSVNDGWSAPVRLDVGNDTSTFPQVAIDANGNAVAVWLQSPSLGLRDVYASRYTTTSGWGIAETIEDDVEFVPDSPPSIAMDPSGNAFVVWSQDVFSSVAVKLNSYTAATEKWDTAANISSINPSKPIQNLNPKVTFGSNVTRVISWTEKDGNLVARVTITTPSNFTQFFNPKINTNIGGNIDYHQAIVDSNGNATIVWQQPDAMGKNIYASHFAAGSGSWSAATLLNTTDTTTSVEPSLAVDPSGNVIAVWMQFNGTGYNVWANRFSNFNKIWGTAERIEEGAMSVSVQGGGNLKIAAAGVNTFSAIWSQYNGGGSDVWTNRFTPNGWGTAEMIESSPGRTTRAVVDFDSNDNGIAIWIQRNAGRDAIFARHFN